MRATGRHTDRQGSAARGVRKRSRGNVQLPYFPMQNVEKITPSRSSAPNAPVISPNRS